MRPMAELRHVLLAVVFTALQLSNGVLSQVTQCVFPSSINIGSPLLSSIVSMGGEGGNQGPLIILDLHVTCLAVEKRGVYREASVAVRYNTSVETNSTTHFTVSCSTSDNEYVAKGSREAAPDSLFSVPTRRDCAACSSNGGGSSRFDPVTNCIECSEDCRNTGRGACNLLGTTCCSVFLEDGTCNQTCPQHFVGTADTNFTCVCPIANQSCINGGVREGVCFCNCDGTGYQGLTCSEDVNECDMSPCEHGGSCTNSIGNFSCACAPGYTGSRCEIDIDECLSNPCDNGGSCSDRVNSFQCTCAPGYTGDTCATDIDECLPLPCKNGGTCMDRVNGFTCTCVSSYRGTTCEEDVDECQNSPCAFDSRCTNTFGNFMCDCPPRWAGQKCDQCNISNCVACENVREGANCTQCADGYRKLKPISITADGYRIDEDQIRETAEYICIQDCDDNWCVECPVRASCQRCQDAFRLTSTNTCTIKGTLPTEAVLAIFVSLIVFVVLVVAVIVIIAGIWLVHYNRTAAIGYSAAKKDPGEVKKELVLTKISEI